MPIRCRCTFCGAVMVLPDKMIGVEGICSQCKSPVVPRVPEPKPAKAPRKRLFAHRRRKLGRR